MKYWTAQEEQALRHNLKLGLSTREIGEIMGVSKNAVCGKINRMGLSKSKGGEKPKKAQRRALYRPKASKGYGPPIKMEAIREECRFPIGDPKEKDFHFCGAESKKGSPYCKKHHKLCYRGFPGGS